MPSEQDKPGGIRKDAPPPEGHAYAQQERHGPPPEGAAYAPPQRQDSEHSAGQPASAGERVSETMERAQQRAGEAGERVREQAEAGRERSAEGMEQAAGDVRERLGHRDDIAGQAAGTAADSLERTAEYVKSHDTAQIMEDLERYIRDHPYQAMIGAFAAGFIISRALR